MSVAVNTSALSSSLDTVFSNNGSGQSNPVSSEVSLENESLQTVFLLLQKVCPPIIVSLGTVGNVLTVLVMRAMNASHTSSISVFFTALAVSDLTILYTGLFRSWLAQTFAFELMHFHDFFCKVCMFLIYSCGMMSSWFLVCMTLQRVMSVMFPYRVGLLCTRRKTQVTVMIVVVFFVLLNVHILYGFTVVQYEDGPWCDYTNDEILVHFDVNIYPWLDLIFTSLLPFSILIIGNGLLVWKVFLSLHVARTMTSSLASSNVDSINGRQRKASSLTTTVICVSVTFICLTLPVCTFYIVYSHLDGSDAVTEVIRQVTRLLWYANSAINFYLYCLTGSRFRKQLNSMFCGRFTPATRSTTASEVSISMTKASGQTEISQMEQNTRSDETEDF